MVNPAVMQQLAGEHRREDLERVRPDGAGLAVAHRSVRQRLGWSLVGLGARLAREPMAGGTGCAHHAPGGQRDRARSVLTLTRT